MKRVGVWDGRGLWICVFHQFPGLQQPGAPAAFPAALFLCALSCVLQAAAPQSPVFAQKLGESLPGVLCPLTGIYSGDSHCRREDLRVLLLSPLACRGISVTPLPVCTNQQEQVSVQRIVRRHFNKTLFSPKFHYFHELWLCREVLGWFWLSWTFLWSLGSCGTPWIPGTATCQGKGLRKRFWVSLFLHKYWQSDPLQAEGLVFSSLSKYTPIPPPPPQNKIALFEISREAQGLKHWVRCKFLKIFIHL